MCEVVWVVRGGGGAVGVVPGIVVVPSVGVVRVGVGGGIVAVVEFYGDNYRYTINATCIQLIQLQPVRRNIARRPNALAGVLRMRVPR